MITAVHASTCEIDQLGRVRHHFARGEDGVMACVVCGAWSLIGNRRQPAARAEAS